MMRSHIFIAEPFAQMSRDTLSHPARIHEHQRCFVLANKLCDAIVDFFPDFVGHHRFERRFRNFDCQIEFAHMTGIDDRATRHAISFDIRTPN